MFLADEAGIARANHVERALQIRVEHRIKILVLHAQHQAVACDARVVDENIDLAEVVRHRFHGFVHRGGIRHVAPVCFCVYAKRRDFVHNSFGLIGAACVDDRHIRAVFGKAQRNGAADASGCARNERRFAV